MAGIRDLIGYLPAAGSVEALVHDLQRECAVCSVRISREVIFEEVAVPLVGSHRVAVRPGRSYSVIEIEQGPVAGIGQRPFPGEVLGDIMSGYAGAAAWQRAERTSFGGIALIIRMADTADLLVELLRRVYWCLRRDGDLRHLALPNPRSMARLLEQAGCARPWRGYDLRAA